VRTELLQHEVIVESMSGDTLEVEVSALKQLNLEQLLEAITLQSELLDLKANPERRAEGFVIEAKLERGRGPVGTHARSARQRFMSATSSLPACAGAASAR
jgi:translation initiation factor IF-2